MNKKINTSIAVGAAIIIAIVLFFISNSFTGLNGGINFDNQENNMQTNNLPEVEGLLVNDVKVGDGLLAEDGMLVTVNYEGILDDGTMFDSSYKRNQPFQFVLGAGQVIRGWDLGVKGMKVGGTRELKISPELGYGAQQIGPIPANSNLNFKVELLGVQEVPKTE